jgi:hypothetical protein
LPQAACIELSDQARQRELVRGAEKIPPGDVAEIREIWHFRQFRPLGNAGDEQELAAAQRMAKKIAKILPIFFASREKQQNPIAG